MDARLLYSQWADTMKFDQPWLSKLVETPRFKPDLVLAEPTDTPGIICLCYGSIEIGEFGIDAVAGQKNATIENLAHLVFRPFFDSLSAHQQLELVEAGGL